MARSSRESGVAPSLVEPTLPSCPAGGWAARYADWAAETNRAAVWHAYRLPPDHRLDERYLQANIRVVNRQLRRAGLRLAEILNTLADRHPPAMATVPPSSPAAAQATLVTGL